MLFIENVSKHFSTTKMVDVLRLQYWYWNRIIKASETTTKDRSGYGEKLADAFFALTKYQTYTDGSFGLENISKINERLKKAESKTLTLWKKAWDLFRKEEPSTGMLIGLQKLFPVVYTERMLKKALARREKKERAERKKERAKRKQKRAEKEQKRAERKQRRAEREQKRLKDKAATYIQSLFRGLQARKQYAGVIAERVEAKAKAKLELERKRQETVASSANEELHTGVRRSQRGGLQQSGFETGGVTAAQLEQLYESDMRAGAARKRKKEHEEEKMQLRKTRKGFLVLSHRRRLQLLFTNLLRGMLKISSGGFTLTDYLDVNTREDVVSTEPNTVEDLSTEYAALCQRMIEYVLDNSKREKGIFGGMVKTMDKNHIKEFRHQLQGIVAVGRENWARFSVHKGIQNTTKCIEALYNFVQTIEDRYRICQYRVRPETLNLIVNTTEGVFDLKDAILSVCGSEKIVHFLSN